MLSSALKALIIFSLSLFSFYSIKFAIAHYYYISAKSKSEKLFLSSEEVNKNTFEDLLGITELSIHYRSRASNTLDFKGDLLYSYWTKYPDGGQLNDSRLLRQALESHGEAAKIRKNWSYSVAKMAVLYSYDNVNNESFRYWYSEAHRLGLYESPIARSMMVLGLENWEELDSKFRSMTSNFTRVVLEHKNNSVSAIKSMVAPYPAFYEVCDSLPRSNKMISVCEKKSED